MDSAADGSSGSQSTLMPVSFAIAVQRGASAAMNAAKSCGDPIFASAPRRAKPACASLDPRISLIAPLSFATMGEGVPAGASSPDQNEATSLGYPLSAVVGTPGSSGERASVATAILLPHVQGGRLRALAVATEARSPLLPGVPTTAESGYPKLLASFWSGLLAPAGTPSPIVEKLNAAINEILRSKDAQAGFARLGAEAKIGSPQD